MMKFNGFVIVIEPDYKEMIAKSVEIDKLNCNVYDENDTEFKNSLFNFILSARKNVNIETVEDVEMAIKEVVDREMTTIQLINANNKLERTKELFQNAVTYIKEVTDPTEYEKVFKDVIGMIDNEFEDTLEELSGKQTQGINLS